LVRSAVVVALSHRTVQAGAGLIAANLAVGDERAGTTLPAKFVKRAVVSPVIIWISSYCSAWVVIVKNFNSSL